MKYLLIIIMLFLIPNKTSADVLLNNGVWNNFIIAIAQVTPPPPTSGHLAFLGSVLDFNGSQLTFMGD